jgi:hypothetical protein
MSVGQGKGKARMMHWADGPGIIGRQKHLGRIGGSLYSTKRLASPVPVG